MAKGLKEKLLVCSFCGTPEEDVDFLVEGDDAFICDTCVKKANEIVKENVVVIINKCVYLGLRISFTFSLQPIINSLHF